MSTLERVEEEEYLTPISGKHVLKIALRVKEIIDEVIPIEFNEEAVTKPDSIILNEKVFELVLRAAGGKGDGSIGTSSRRYRACLVFVLLTVKRWYDQSADNFLYDSELYSLRGTAAECLAKRIIERQSDEYYLFKYMLCQRYTITLYGRDATPANALELAVDLHATVVIGSSGYNRCVSWLWRGWIVQGGGDDSADTDTSDYVFYKKLGDPRFAAHFDPDRIKTPKYQNYIQLIFSFIYLAIYTLAINHISMTHVSPQEIWLAIFTIGFLGDEMVKFYHVGYAYVGFWNVFNSCLYLLITAAGVIRGWSFTHGPVTSERLKYGVMSYHLLSCAAPLVWSRILLYLDSVRFFGAMLVVLKELMKESLIFFVLLVIIAGGFLQAFMGLDEADGDLDVPQLVIQVMTRTVLADPNFDAVGQIAPPYGGLLYYIFTFLISTILLNILIALFNSAYEKIYDNATDEYLSLLAQKTLRFVRAPDEYVFVPPLNLFEFLFLTVPFSWWLSKRTYYKLNYYFMMLLYSPALVLIAFDEMKTARRVLYNRSKGASDDANERDEEWDLLDGYYEDNPGTTRQVEQMERAIENGDPEFPIDEEQFSKDLKAVAPKVSSEGGTVSWEHAELIERINKLTQLVNDLKSQVSN